MEYFELVTIRITLPHRIAVKVKRIGEGIIFGTWRVLEEGQNKDNLHFWFSRASILSPWMHLRKKG